MPVKEWPLPIGRTRRPAAAAEASTDGHLVGRGRADDVDDGPLVAGPVAPAVRAPPAPPGCPSRARSLPSDRTHSSWRRTAAGQPVDQPVAGPARCAVMSALRLDPTTSAAGWTWRRRTSSPPLAVLDLDALDANADDLVRRAGGKPDPGGEQVGALPRRAAPGAGPAGLRRGPRLLAARGAVARHRRRPGQRRRRRRLPDGRPAGAAAAGRRRRGRRPGDAHGRLRRPARPGRRRRPAGPAAGRCGSASTSTRRCARPAGGCTSGSAGRRSTPPTTPRPWPGGRGPARASGWSG